jgi:tetratricopeptide (TPR) repeat protein
MQKLTELRKVGAVLAVLLCFAALELAAADKPKKEASLEMEFGYKAARRGYWQEALMRFERANELTPNQAHILNNIAVAQEANGLYEQALLTYQTGLAVDPNDKALRRNYSRFQEFYATYVNPPEESEGAATESGGGEDEQAED